MSQLRDDLNAVADLLERGWCQRTLARTSDGRCVPVEHPEAIAFDLDGAIDRVGLHDREQRWAMREALYETVGVAADPCLAAWNDRSGQTKEHVIAEVRRTAEAAL